MEIKEIVSFYINDTTKTLDVTFRTLLDSDEELREDKIYFEEVRDFGYDFINDENDNYRGILGEDFDDDFDEDYYDESDVDEQEIISFLNEYYLIYPSKLPDSEIF
jgi:hypothetical protein